MKKISKSKVTQVEIIRRTSHRWDYFRRDATQRIEQQRLKEEQQAFEKEARERFEEIFYLARNILTCRTRKGKVGPEYEILRRRLVRLRKKYPGFPTKYDTCLIREVIETGSTTHLVICPPRHP